MKALRILLLAMFVSAMGCLVSCKEETPADKLNNTTQSLEKKAEALKVEAEKKTEEAK